MFKKVLSIFLVVLILAFNAPAAFAATETADFEGLGYNNGQQIEESVPIDGFRFSTSTGEGMDYCIGYGADGSAGIIAHYTITPVAWIQFRLENNDDFALTSIYYDNTQYGNGYANECEIQGYNDGVQVLTMPNVSLVGTGTIMFSGWNQVDAVRIEATGGLALDLAVVFDNIVYEIVATSSVPYMDINHPLTLDEGETVPITSSILRAADNDSIASALQYTVTTPPVHGQLENTSAPGTAITTFTQEQIDNGEICYAHDHSDTTSDSFVFKVSDGTNELTNQTFQITVTPVFDPSLPENAKAATFDDLPYDFASKIPCTMPIDGFLFTTPSNEGMLYFQTGGQDNTPVLSVYDYASTLTITRNDGSEFKLHSIYLDDHVGYGSDTYKIEGYLNGSLVTGYEKDVNVRTPITVTFDEWAGNVDEVHITAITGTTPKIAGYIDNIVYIPGTVSSVPYVAVNLPVTLAEGGTLTIDNNVLRAEDNDSEASALQYIITTAPLNGWLEKADNPGTAITGFTQGDIDSGKIRYVHNHTDTLSDSFVFKVSDGINELTNQTFYITVTPVYDDPIPDGARVATFDNLSGTYVNGAVIPAGTPVDGFLFSASDGSAMQYYNWPGQDKTACMAPLHSSGTVEKLTITRSNGADFRLYSIYLDDHNGYGSDTYKIEGYLNGSKVDGYNKDVNVRSPITVPFTDWTGYVDEVHITAITGTTPEVAGYIDNIVYRDANTSPKDITLSAATVAENAASGTVIGTFSTDDDDADDTFTYLLVPGTGDTDNTSFTIVDNVLQSAAAFDYEKKSSYSIRVRTTDAAGAAYEKEFTITVTDVYEKLAVTTNNPLSLLEDALPATIGSDKLGTTVNDGLTATYTLTVEPAKGILKNDGTEIDVNDTFTQANIDAGLITYTPNADKNGTDSFTFSVSDGMNTVTDTFNITITAINDVPTVFGLPATVTANEDQSINFDLSSADFNDPDGDTLTITLTASAGTFTAGSGGSVIVAGSGTATLTLSGTAEDINTFLDTASNIQYTGTLNASGTVSITVTASDGTVNLTFGTVSVNITALNDDPTITGLPSDITVAENVASNVDLSAAYFSDADSGSNSIRLILSAGPGDAGILSALSSGDVTVSGSGTSSLTLFGTAANIDTYLNTASNIKYTGPAGVSGNDAANLTLTANDGGNTGAGGGADVILGTVNIDITEAAPTITNITSTKADGTYGIGEEIDINVVFTKAVTVDGTPQLTLEIGTTDRIINYTGGTGTNVLTFTYTPQSGDESADLDYVSSSALTLNGGTIKTASGTDAVLTLPSPGAPGSLGANKAIKVQAFPTVNLSVGSANISEDGGTSRITATLSEISSQDVVVTLSYSGTAASGTDYSTPDTSITIPAGSLFANAAVGITAIQDSDAEGNETIIIDIDSVSKGFEDGNQQQTITILDDDIAVVTSIASMTKNGSYKAGDTVSIQVSFSEVVTVTGTPTISLNSGGTAVYQSGSGTNTLTFAYTVQAGDTSADLDYAGTSALSLAGGSIQNSGLDASLVLPTPGGAGSLGANNDIVIDTTAPSAPSTPNLAASSDSGISYTDDITNDTTPAFTGMAEANSTVTLYSSVTQIGTATADGSGNWSITSGMLTPGSHTITATATDVAGNVSTASAALSITIDTTAPTGTVSMSDTALVAGEACEVTFTFTEAVTGFTNDDLMCSNGALSHVASVDGGITYTAIFTADSINDDINIIVVDLTGITDIAGNAGSGTITSPNYTIIIPTAPGTPTAVTATAGDGQATVSFTPPVSDGGAAITSYMVTASPGGITATGSASPITVTGLTNGTSYTFTVTATNSAGTSAASAPSNSVTPRSVPSGGESQDTPTTGEGSPNTPTQTYHAEVKTGDSGGFTLPVTVNRNSGNVTIDTGSRSGLISSGETSVITMPSIPDASNYTLGIPVPYLSTTDKHGYLTIDTDKGSITVTSNMLTGVEGVDGEKAQITIGEGNKSHLPDALKTAIGNKPLIRLSLSIDGKQTDWSNPGAPVTVRIPYTPTAAELANPESIIVWYIDGSGNPQCIINGRYDAETGTVTFQTTHFSDYAVVYNKVSFKDVASGAWYYKPVSFIAARGITTGTYDGSFSPDAKLTRSQFIVMLMKAYNIPPEENSTDNFTDAGSTYYTGYLAAAKKLGISEGVGNNLFAPEKEITRQEMFTLLYNALKVIGQLPQGNSGNTLLDFSDAGQIDSWAKEAITLLVETGTISGNAGLLTPTSTTTRSEMAQVLYNLLSR